MAHQIQAAVNPVEYRHAQGGGLAGWFRQASTTRNAYALLAFAAIGYSIGVALPLAIAKANAMPDPYLRIAAADYFYWGIYFYAPVIAAAWLLASAVIYLIGWGFGRKADFGELLRFTAFATGIGTLGTLLSDLVTSPLRAMGVINEQAWEQSILSQGGWWLFLWFFIVIYVALFCVGYPIAVRLATKLSWARSIIVGAVGFLVFQGFEYIFIR
jgi:hypothetical protein